jgi:hypothetical protein
MFPSSFSSVITIPPSQHVGYRSDDVGCRITIVESHIARSIGPYMCRRVDEPL